MNTKHDPVKKQRVISRYKSGEPISHIIQDTGILRSTIYNWLKLSKAAEDDRKEPTLLDFRMLEKKVKRLEGIIEILKTADCSPKDSLCHHRFICPEGSCLSIREI
jgi:putative transposase